MAAGAAVRQSSSTIFTPETLRAAAKQSSAIHRVPLALRTAIKRFLRDNGTSRTKRDVLQLSATFERAKETVAELSAAATRDMVSDPRPPPVAGGCGAARWKIKSRYGDCGINYNCAATAAYVAVRMPASYAACHRVLREIKRRIPDYSPAKLLDFGAGPSSALWAMREVWPKSIKRVNLVEPSKDMQRAAQSLLQKFEGLPLIHSYENLQELHCDIHKHQRRHDIVISSYTLGEIPSLSDQITVVRQLWDLTGDILVLIEPGTPQGSKIISQMRSYLLWMEKRRCIKEKKSSKQETSNARSISLHSEPVKSGAFVVAPCPHDGRCPLENSNKYCHFVQRLERTSSQRAYKKLNGASVRGYEDEKFSYVVLRRGSRPQKPWPLDGMKFETLRESRERSNSGDHIIDSEDEMSAEETEIDAETEAEAKDEAEARRAKGGLVLYESDMEVASLFHKDGVEELDEAVSSADLGGGFGRIVYSPIRRGKQVQLDVCRATKHDASEGAFERIVVTKSKNPALHFQARRSLWGDLWPC